MKWAVLKCHGCGDFYDVTVEDNQTFAKCPICSQRNVVPDNASPVTGICSRCQKPIDMHLLDERGNIRRCPKGE